MTEVLTGVNNVPNVTV